MNTPPRKRGSLVVVGILTALLAMAAALLLYGLRANRGARTPAAPLSLPLPDFTLTNQDHQPVTLASLRGNVWVADIIFTRCAGPCPGMTRQMSELQKTIPADSPVRFVTLTTDPEFDTPEVLKRYGERFGADFRRWLFLTGTKPEIGRLAIDGLKLTVVEKKPEERDDARDLFVHSTLFVVVDRQGRLRAAFESDDPAWPSELLQMVRLLTREP
jgi:cytochrome oxidase Cu insertion factor (SCO1/SenC/PrrC family)